jgi:hypothetical protein
VRWPSHQTLEEGQDQLLNNPNDGKKRGLCGIQLQPKALWWFVLLYALQCKCWCRCLVHCCFGLGDDLLHWGCLDKNLLVHYLMSRDKISSKMGVQHILKKLRHLIALHATCRVLESVI